MTRRQNLLKKAVADAEKAEQAKSYFLATMSHEIRTPLNAVIGFSELLKDNTLPENERQDYLNDIAIAGNALLALINDILDLSKLESGQMDFKKTETVFTELVQEIRSVFLTKLQEKKLECVVELPPMPCLLTDKQRIRQILFNLIGNAVKFTNSGTITVSGEFVSESADTGTLYFSVKDTGCGIKPEDQERVFQPFVQSSTHRGTQAANNGTGLGLAIVRRMLDRMNGAISLVSEPGSGSLFTVAIHHVQFLKTPAASHACNDNPVAGITCKEALQMRVLLVDDVRVNLKVVKAMCDKLGLVNVKTASGGVDALALIEKEPFDLVLTDMWMPGMNGTELAQKIRDTKNGAHTTIYALTADIEAQSGFDLHHFSGILLKPITLEKIVRVVNECAAKK